VLTAGGLDVSAGLEWAAGVIGPVTGVRELTGGWTSTMLALTTDGDDDVVLRLMTREPWRTHGAELTIRESEIQEMLAGTPVPAPRTLALDVHGQDCGFPAHLMTLLPGRVDIDRVDGAFLGELADLLVTIHDVAPTIEVRAYQSWAWEAKFQAPRWGSDPGLWEEAFALLRTAPPEFQPCFIHRDFQPRNLLWSEGHVTGVVDWVETSMGPAWLDVAHCSTNLAIVHGSDAADLFAAAYAERADCDAEPYFDVMDVVGFLPPPGRDAFFEDDSDENRRLEERLRAVMQRTRSWD
jgi:aminoglycoside phosphotransferase (APT) family kinase protein